MRVDNDNNKLVLNKNYQIARFSSLMIAILGAIMGSLGFRDDNSYIIAISFFYSALMLLSFIYVSFSKKPTFFFYSGGALMLFLEVSFIFNGGSEGFGIIWVTIMPLFSVYLVSAVPFFIINSIYLSVLIAFFWTPLSKYTYAFDPAFVTRFPLVYIVDFIFATFLQFRIRQTEKQLQEQKVLLDKEINNAGLIQKTFYPHIQTQLSDWNISYKTKPMAGVSGDLYDFYTIGDRLDGCGIFDISGHGISAGILTMLTKNIIQQEFYADTKCNLWETVNKINERFVAEKGDVSNYFTGVLVKITDTQIELVNAAHPAPILYKKSTNTFKVIKNHPNAIGPIGMAGLPSVYVSQFLAMESGDELFLYSDGILETQNRAGEQFDEERLLETIQKHISEDLNTQNELLFKDIHNFKRGAASTDDITMIILQKK